MNHNVFIIPAFVAFLISFVMTPIAIKIAYHVNAIDVPNDERRVHNKPIPLLGGLAVYVSCMICIAMFSKLPSQKLIAIVIGASLIAFTGFIDDINPISAKYKFIVQIISASILVFNGIKITSFSNILNFNAPIVVNELVGTVASIIWIVGITNTFNLIDGLDGLTTGVATISSLTLSYVAFLNGRYETMIITLILAGSCLGFLPYNFNPAKIFMGDTGSLFLGFILGAISIDGTIKTATFITVFIPIFALGLPVLDTGLAIIRRISRGQSPFSPDKEHIHHKLLNTGIGQRKTVLFLYFINSLFGITCILLLTRHYIESIVLILVTFMILYYNIKKG